MEGGGGSPCLVSNLKMSLLYVLVARNTALSPIVSNVRNPEEAVLRPQYSPRPLYYCQYNGQGVYCGLNTASEVFLIFTTQLYQYSNYFSLFFFNLVTNLKYSFDSFMLPNSNISCCSLPEGSNQNFVLLHVANDF